MSSWCRLCFVCLFFVSVSADGQETNDGSQPAALYKKIIESNPRIYKRNDTVWIYSGICKPLKMTRYTGTEAASYFYPVKHSRDLVISGHLQYDFLYRSFADTPYYQRDFRQHTLQTSLSITVKDRYPLRVNFMLRHSNSPYFKNFFDGGLQFDKHAYERKLRQLLAERILSKLLNRPDLSAAEAALKEKLKKYEALQRKLNSDGVAQQLIEERERIYFGNTQPRPTIDDDSLQNRITTIIEEKKKELDSLRSSAGKLQSYIDSVKNKISFEAAAIKQKIYKATNPAELTKLARENGVNEEQSKWSKFLSDIKSVSIGRSVLNYSELTARNVSLTGFSLEYNPRIYAAVAAGKIDYGFRDFFGRNSRGGNQHLIMGRIGWGNIDRKAVILSVFTGRKTNYDGLASDTATGSVLVTGYSMELIARKNEQTGFSAEIAKSTRPVTGRYNDNKELRSLFRMNDNSNLGISVKGQTIIRETNTRLSGFFRKTGENFQSFSLFSYNTDQTAWSLKADQSFLKNRINLIAMLRRNDFVNPFTEKTFKTTTVFKSLQVSLRIPKWPSLSVGYFPGSQLYIIDRDRVRENVYYILNGTMIHNYQLFGVRMVSSAIYNNYSTKGTDSGFVNYSGTSYMLSQSLLWRKLQVQGNFIYTDQQELKFYTLDGNADYSVKDFLRLGAGIKYNKVLSGDVYWGGRAQLMIGIKQMGSLQLQYEKSFLPTIQQTLFPVEIGRLSWFKYF